MTMPILRILAPVLILIILAASAAAGEVTVRELPIFNEKRLALTREYARAHYGAETDRLENPQMIVVHFTAFATMKESLDFFRPTLLTSRDDIKSGGRVNVSAHYMVDKGGEIYRTAADDILCRHIIGFNHLALGIENVAGDQRGLTDAQLKADAELIAELVRRHPTVNYLIGHHEYEDRSLPHYRLRLELQKGYRPTAKVDPGREFMARLRELLKEKYALELLR
jgi:N-acetylmuramoyl-L-alanine amidase